MRPEREFGGLSFEAWRAPIFLKRFLSPFVSGGPLTYLSRILIQCTVFQVLLQVFPLPNMSALFVGERSAYRLAGVYSCPDFRLFRCSGAGVFVFGKASSVYGVSRMRRLYCHQRGRRSCCGSSHGPCAHVRTCPSLRGQLRGVGLSSQSRRPTFLR